MIQLLKQQALDPCKLRVLVPKASFSSSSWGETDYFHLCFAVLCFEFWVELFKKQKQKQAKKTKQNKEKL